ncbi:MAG: Helix-turn-helix domain protein [Firmicutes bacterium ADurb.Bin193]|nr:MAG: Helix-turn-helix domain protein [Firmicutes bacterium ADurb.Bin193]
MNDGKQTFGAFVREKREAIGMSLRGVAAEIEMAPAYLSDIEKGNRWPPVKYLEKMVETLKISGEELNQFYDLAGEIRDGEYPDLTDYIVKTDIARVALRKARDHNISETQWQKFIDGIDKKK